MRVNDLLSACAKALDGVETVRIAAHQAVSGRVKVDGKIDKTAMDADQFLVHRYAWLATYVDGLRQMLGWAQRLDAAGNLGDLEALILQAGYGEYLNQIAGGIAISQVEIVRPTDMGLTDADLKPLSEGAAQHLRAAGNTAAVRDQIAELMANGHFGDLGLGDETLEMIRDQFCRFVEDQVTPHAHAWHLNDDLIPMEVVNQMSDFGVFGVTIPERWSGLGMSKIAMCVVTEELSRGYIGVASLGTRSDIAAELILAGGTEEQKNTYLPKIASGEILPTVVFTEPETGSDLGSLRTRASLVGDVYKVNGNKTWISNGACTDLMTLLVRTKPDETGYKGLSMFLAEKPRSEDPTNPFPAQGMSGGEIEVLGYRGMKEYEIGFDDFEIPRGQLLGGQEGQGFKQLMATFESARVQTAARAIGVAQNALELGLTYALGRT